jgi:hypothetical protein
MVQAPEIADIERSAKDPPPSSPLRFMKGAACRPAFLYARLCDAHTGKVLVAACPQYSRWLSRLSTRSTPAAWCQGRKRTTPERQPARVLQDT